MSTPKNHARVEHHVSVSLLIAAALSGSAWCQSEIWSLTGSHFDGFATAAAGVGDLNGDGTPDVAVGSEGLNQVQIVSGGDGSMIMLLSGPTDSHYGAAVASLGDVNADGVPDIAVGAPLANSPGLVNNGQLFVISGADGSTLWTDQGLLDQDRLGSAIRGLGDVDLDGHGDLAYAAVTHGDGVCRVASGANGTVLAQLAAGLVGPYTQEPYTPAGGADVDGDDVPDMVVKSPASLGLGLDVYSGAALAAGQPGLIFHRDFAVEGFRADLCDWDGDGTAEVVVGEPLHYPLGVQGRVVVLDAQGQELDEFTGLPGQRWFGLAVSTLGDADGDGREDVAVTSDSLYGFGATAFASFASMVSGANGKHLADSARDGEPHTMTRVGDLDGDGLADMLAVWSSSPSAPYPVTVAAISSRQGSVTGMGAACQPAGTPALGLWVYGEASVGGWLSLVATGPQLGAKVWLGLGSPAAPTTLPNGCEVHVAPVVALLPIELSYGLPGVGPSGALIVAVPPSISALSVAIQTFGKDHNNALVMSAAMLIEIVD